MLSACDHPVSIVTKSALVLRDLDILAPMAARGLASVALSVTTLDAALARRVEPRAATPPRRLAAMAHIAQAGVPTMVMAAPMIPAINDHELETILEAAAAADARSASYILVRLPLEIKHLFHEWLEAHYPDRAERVEKLIRSARGGQLYDARFRTGMRGTGEYADLLARRFRVAARRLGLDRKLPPLDTSQFRRPPRHGEQLSLL